MVLVPKAQW